MVKPRAFTLVEILVVISIITLLVAIITPTLSVVKDMGRAATCASNLNATMRDILMYAEDNAGHVIPYRLARDPNTGKDSAPAEPYLTTIAFGLDADPPNHPDSGMLRDARNLGYGYVQEAFNDYERLYCPDQPNEQNEASNYVKPWGTGDKEVYAGYMYNPNVQLLSGNSVHKYRPEIEYIPTDSPMVCDLVYGEKYLSHAIGSEWQWNVAHINGNVSQVKSADAQKYITSNPSDPLANDWEIFNSTVYRSVLMR